MTFIIIFTAGYLIGGVSALIILGLTVAARRGNHGDHDSTTSTPLVPAEETIAAGHQKG